MKSIGLTLLAGLSALALVSCGAPSGPAKNSEPTAASSNNPAPAAQISAQSAPAFPEHVYWGDEHVHSAWSADAGMAGASLTPEDAVRYARGEEVKSNTGQMAKRDRPLDWIAVTDHSDGMGTINLIRSGNPEMMADPRVKRWHDMMLEGGAAAKKVAWEVIGAQATQTVPKVLMEPKWMVSAWEKTVDIMEKYNEPGKFTAFIAYEWTSNGTDGNNLHRNVIYRENADKTRAYPPLTTFVSADPAVSGSDPESLWKWLADWEQKTGGQVLAIPHNGDLSNGQMFDLKRYNGSALTKQWAEDRARWEVLVEVFQYKGQGEAHPSLSPNDEFASFGLWDTANLNGIPKTPGEIKTEYAREALKNGLLLEGQFGVNPFKFGMAGGTDTHTALPSGGEPNNWWGKFAYNEPAPGRWNGVYQKQKNGVIRKDWTLLSAGLTGVWATENTRGTLWDAMKRKETYATSGPRMSLRFFGGYDFSNADANAATLVATGYARGVPMGGDLKAAANGKAPTFLFAAMKDPTGGNLDSVQIIKGWVDAQGKTHEHIYNVAWSEQDKRKETNGKLTPVGNTVDVATATYANSIGATDLIGVFTDPEFDPKLRAFYYLRAVEIPTPRWTLYDSVKYKVKMAAEVPMFQQERAVTSPIWYNPG